VAFELHPRLAADTAFIADWPLSRVLLMNDSRFPWLILVPRRAGIIEWFELDDSARPMLMGEVARASERLKAWAGADKINIGIIGNVVAQLHIHVIARNKDDSAWPGTVWGAGQPIPYAAPVLQRVVGGLRQCLDQ
jgi:diadenosine tetraphosphate (Ap4A) HIT family hydrolase